MILSGLFSKSLSNTGRAALVGLATLLMPMTSSMGQDAPDREEVGRESVENRSEALDLSDVEYTAGPRNRGEANRNRPDRRGHVEGRPAGRPEGGEKAVKKEEESGSRAKAHAEMRQAEKELVKAAHRIVELEVKISHRHEHAAGPQHGERHADASRNPHHEEGERAHHAGGASGRAHHEAHAEHHEGEAHHRHHEHGKCEHHAHHRHHEAGTSEHQAHHAAAKHHEHATSEHQAHHAAAEHHEAGGENAHRPTDHMVRGGPVAAHSSRARNESREMELDRQGGSRDHNPASEGGPRTAHSDSPKSHDDHERINQIEKKLDELIRVVHGMKSHETKEKETK